MLPYVSPVSGPCIKSRSLLIGPCVRHLMLQIFFLYPNNSATIEQRSKLACVQSVDTKDRVRRIEIQTSL
jgi:hypothetical protein